MRIIGSLPDERQARTFGDYLYVQGIRNDVEADAQNAWSVWVHEEDQLDQARTLLERFRQHPNAPEFRSKAKRADELRFEESKDQAEYEKRFHDKSRLFPNLTPYGPGLLTLMLIGLCVTVAVWSQLGRNPEALKALFISNFPSTLPGYALAEVRHGEVWRLLTPILLHFDPFHILFNMMWLFQLGSMIEARRSTWHLAALIFVTALISNLGEYFLGRGFSFGGMSGVVYGLFGYVWIRGKLDPASGLYIDRTNVILMLVWFFLCFTPAIGRIANVAHAGGLVTGMVLGLIASRPWNR